MKPVRLSFSPALQCVECQYETTQGLIYPMSALAWQLIPFCHEHEVPPDLAESVSLPTLRCRINQQLAEIQQLQRRKHHLARAYTWLRRQHAPGKMRRALRWQLNQADKLQAEGMEALP